MSHAHGALRWPDGTVSFFEYNATVDVATTAIRSSLDEVQDHWRKDNMRKCDCDVAHIVPVDLYTTHAGGFYWEATACANCQSIIDGASSEDSTYGVPQWVPDELADR